MRTIFPIVLVGCGFQGAPVPESIDAPINTSSDAPSPEAGSPMPDAAPSGLIAWYEMESGPPAMDSTGKGHTGTCTNCPDLVQGKHGNGYHFHTGTSRIDVAQAADLMTTVAFTVALWVNFDSLPGNGAYSCPINRNYGNQYSNAWQLCLHGVTGASQEWLFYTAGPGTGLAAPSTLRTGQWHHLAITWDGQMKQIWFDGASVASVAATTVLFDQNVMTIGADVAFNTTQDAPFDGVIDDVRIYDHTLGTGEIAALAKP